LRVLMIGDVVGRPGRRAVQHFLPGLRHDYELGLVIANGENTAGGIGITPDTAKELCNCGVDVITTGNHVWAKKEIMPYMDGELPIVRPLNFPPGVPGRGFLEMNGVLVVNIIGRVFIGQYDCPFRAMDCFLSEIKTDSKVIIVDFHAEATSEKIAMGHYLDGRVSAILGTHTHVPTADCYIMPKGSAYVSDVGMVGPVDSVIGVDTESAIRSFLTGMPHRFFVSEGNAMFDAIMVDVDEGTGKATNVKRIHLEE
jgi:metallophosphoesterase (TIGR00282 family)